MKYVFAIIVLACVSACMPPKYEGTKFVGGSYRYVYYDNVSLSNQSIRAINQLPEFDGKGQLGAIAAFNKKYASPNPSAEVGARIADVMGERFKFKRIKPDMKLAYAQHINGEMDKDSAADYWLVVDTPLWRIQRSVWSDMVKLQYAIQYRLFDVKDQKLLFGNTCIYETDKIELADMAANDFARMREAFLAIPAYCNDEIIETIDPNKSGYVSTRRM